MISLYLEVRVNLENVSLRHVFGMRVIDLFKGHEWKVGDQMRLPVRLADGEVLEPATLGVLVNAIGLRSNGPPPRWSRANALALVIWLVRFSDSRIAPPGRLDGDDQFVIDLDELDDSLLDFPGDQLFVGWRRRVRFVCLLVGEVFDEEEIVRSSRVAVDAKRDRSVLDRRPSWREL